LHLGQRIIAHNADCECEEAYRLNIQNLPKDPLAWFLRVHERARRPFSGSGKGAKPTREPAYPKPSWGSSFRLGN